MDVRNSDGQTPLHTTAERGATVVVRQYIGIGADIMAQDNDGRTPLHLAAKNGHGATVTVLLQPNDEMRIMLEVLSVKSFSIQKYLTLKRR
jgi:ankyrin repeat protein